MPVAELIFANHARQMQKHGLAVLPVGRDKIPCVSGFAKWSRPPTEATIAKWIEQYPADNIAIIPGLSNVLVADVDDLGDVPLLEDLLGPSPVRVSTGRGTHLYYRDPRQRLPTNLRMFGLNADLKTGNSIVVAPPSIHQSGRRYTLHGEASWADLADLPVPDLNALHSFIERDKPPFAAGRDGREMRDGSRRQWLNDQLCRHVSFCETFRDLLDVARTENQGLAERGLVPLEDDVVIQRAEKVWADAEDGRFEAWVGREGVARAKDSELQHLARLSAVHGADAFMLLMHLRLKHAARGLRGETFAITPKAMARHQTIPGWSGWRYTRARDLLLRARLVEKVAEFQNSRHGRKAAQYRLTGHGGGGGTSYIGVED
jgi:Bifunctional DNA primase/polymerase, N-terminal